MRREFGAGALGRVVTWQNNTQNNWPQFAGEGPASRCPPSLDVE